METLLDYIGRMETNTRVTGRRASATAMVSVYGPTAISLRANGSPERELARASTAGLMVRNRLVPGKKKLALRLPFVHCVGSRYEGEWKNGCHHGYGIYTWLDGRSYEGQWEANKKHGMGTYRFDTEGCSYTGSWEDGFRQGLGTSCSPFFGICEAS